MTATTKTPVRRKPASKRAAAAPAADAAANRRKVSSQQAIATATIPDQKYLDTYVSRKITDSITDFQVFEYADKLNHNMLLEGPTGSAKTSVALAYAAKVQKPFYAIPSNIGIEPSQLFGKFVPSPDGTIHWVDGPVTQLVRRGGVLLINEVNFMPERVATVLFGLLDKRRQITLLDHNAEVIDAHPDLLIVADMNPEYEGTRPLNKAFRNRFAVQLQWDYNDEVESVLIKSKALRELAKKLRADMETGGIDTPCSTNMLMEFERVFDEFGYDFAVMNFVNHFQPDERQSLGVIVETFKQNIIDDLDVKARKAREAAERKAKAAEAKRRKELEELIDPERVNVQRVDYVEVEDEDGTTVKQLALIDDEWGVEGVDWVYEGDEDEEYDAEYDATDDAGLDEDDNDDGFQY
ncbi:AAA-ATPase [Gordonia phage ChisanaKitsune]|uniref:AAA-ATPase n=1 Tax=Gordonia phage ChisanaKitsune TaxID=2871538 RepID=A0AAE8BX21_9CAUD|nr:porphyrin biosynthesis [Gordonia phage ChisanaKitsune]QZE10838.1 AAA-ATPase [Gordonia phage ChisanaKitsune]